MSGLVAVGALGLAWVGIWAGLKLKHRLKEPVPERFHSQFLEPGGGFLASVSGKEHQVWKKLGRQVTVSCTLYERAEPHGAAVRIEGEYEMRAGSRDRNGLVKADFRGKEYQLSLDAGKVGFQGPNGSLGTLSLVDGVMDCGLRWERTSSFRGPDGSGYQRVLIGGRELYLCTRGKGGKLYSPLVVGEVDDVGPEDLERLLCLGVLWHGVFCG